MRDLSGKNIVLFCPRFFDYEIQIKKGLQRLGANVMWYDDRPSNDFFSKAIIRINKNFIAKTIDSYYSKIIGEIVNQSVSIDYILFVNPESIREKNINLLKKAFPAAKFILYMWDSFGNRKHNRELLPYFDAKFTFDPKDAQEHNLTLLPLFYIDEYSEVTCDYQYDLLFIGTAHSDRYNFIERIKMQLTMGLSIKLYFFLSSKLLYVIRKIKDKEFRKVKYNEISFQSLGHKENAKFMANSRIILDINHPQQLGLTMRTFETLGAQRKLITTNRDVKSYDFYNENNILVIDRDNPIINNEFLTTPFIPSSSEILFKYSIEGWLKTLLNLK
jgi:hypothetical protein